MSQYHNPVMLKECVEFLNIRKGGIYVDATLGGGGHSLAIISKHPDVQLYAFDQDAEAIEHAGQVLQDYSDRVSLIHCNFRDLRTVLALRKIKTVDGILFDLGVSSHQFDDKSRGFSFESDNPLDMRMDKRQETTARDLINELSTSELVKIFKEYGEERHSTRIARAIEKARTARPLETTQELASIVESVLGGNPKDVIKSKARIFQSLRIYLNRELDILESTIKDSINILAPGGRIVILSYHSLEDRCVKNLFRNAAKGCVCPPQVMKCICNKKPLLKVITTKPLEATVEEIKENSRSRSAKLRAAEKLGTSTDSLGRRDER